MTVFTRSCDDDRSGVALETCQGLQNTIGDWSRHRKGPRLLRVLPRRLAQPVID